MNAAFVARMEDVLAVYARPHDPRFPVVCFDERPCVLHAQPVEPLPAVPAQPAVGEQPAKAGRPRRESSTYVRQGTACLLAAFEPGTGQRLVEVSARRTGADYCRFMQQLAAHYPQAEKIVLVQDNLNTHTDAVFYQHLPAAQARALAARFEVHYTPKNASWLTMVELELSAIARQCLHQRIPTQEELTAHVAACVAERNTAQATVKWQFTLEKARVKLDRHYQKIRTANLPD
ncbi:IS630 family transposase [Hymenobacter elongatus]|nr:IS630 family transposase [Hymenobacter elongatus]